MRQQPPGIGRDPATFEAFYRQTVHDLERFVARRVTDPHVVADLVADSYVTIIEQASRYDPERGSARAWAFGIARHVIQDHERQQALHLRSTSHIAGRALLNEASEDDLAARIDAEREARRQLPHMATLPDGERDLLALVAVDGLSVTEAAQVLGLRPGTARVRLHRARQHLNPTHPQEALPCPSH